jgi:predicted acyl esterase
MAAPALHIGGWFDLFLGGTLDNFAAVSQRGATERARRGQRLIIGPWSHADRSGGIGELHFGALASDVAIGLEQLTIGFLRACVRPGSPGSEVPASPGSGCS